MNNTALKVFEKTATFYRPQDYKAKDQRPEDAQTEINRPVRQEKSKGKMFDFQLKVQGRKIVQTSQPSTSDTNLQQNKTSSTIQNEQFTPPQKRPIHRKGSVIQIRSDDKVVRTENRIQSSNLYQQASYEFPIKALETREMSFGNHDAQEIMDEKKSKKNSRRVLLKKHVELLPRSTQVQSTTDSTKRIPVRLLPSTKKTFTNNESLQNKLPDIYLNTQKKISFMESQFVKRATSAGFGLTNSPQKRVPDNEFLDYDEIPQFQSGKNVQYRIATQPTYHPTHIFAVYKQKPFVELPMLDSVAKSRPFLQRKAQTKILDRIFSGK